MPARQARLAVTSHDVLQLLRYEPPRRRELLGRVFERADVILSVSRFNTEHLREAFPACRDRVAYVPNAADDLFFEPPTDRERSEVRADLEVVAGQLALERGLPELAVGHLRRARRLGTAFAARPLARAYLWRLGEKEEGTN